MGTRGREYGRVGHCDPRKPDWQVAKEIEAGLEERDEELDECYGIMGPAVDCEPEGIRMLADELQR